MARFFIDICMPDKIFVDSDGLDFSDFHEAIMEAHAAADNLRREAAQKGLDVSDHSFVVRDAEAEHLTSVSFSGTIH